MDEDVAGATAPPILPDDVRFLAACGVPVHTLLRAARQGRREGVCAAKALLAHGMVEPERVYRALAAAIGAPFLARPLLAPDVRFPESLLSGLAPLAEGGTVVAAPHPETFAARLAGGRVAKGVCVTTPNALQEAVFGARAVEIAEEAANGLSVRRPELSFRGGFGRGQIVALVGLAAVFLALIVYVPGTRDIVACVAGACFMVIATLRLATCLEPAATAVQDSPPRMAEADLPVYTIVVPLYREANVVGGLCRALTSLDYPLSKLDVKLVVEEDDPVTRAAIVALALPGAFQMVVAPAGQPRTKPRALNVALPLARGSLVVVYDAEDRPEPDQLRLAVAGFAREEGNVACLQARLSIHNRDALLPRLFAIEYAALFDVVNPALTRYGLPIPLGGTSNHFRTRSLRLVHGWDAHNVTEDADLGIRLATLGMRTADLPSTTWEEAPVSLGNWLRQRARWTKGFLQVCVVYGRAPGRTLGRLGPGASFASLVLIGGTVASALAYPLFAWMAIASVLALFGVLVSPYPLDTGSLRGLMVATVGLSTLLAGAASIYAPAFVGLSRRGWRGMWGTALWLPVYYALVCLAAWRGLFELFTAPSHWHKTEHGAAPAAQEPAAQARASSNQMRRKSSAAASEGARVVSRPATKRPWASMM